MEVCVVFGIGRLGGETFISFPMDIGKRIEDLGLVSFDVLHSIQMDLIHLLNRRDQLKNVQKHIRLVYRE